MHLRSRTRNSASEQDRGSPPEAFTQFSKLAAEERIPRNHSFLEFEMYILSLMPLEQWMACGQCRFLR